MLTPLDIQNKNFKRTFRGYNADQVDDFLDEIVNEMERLYRDNDNLKAEITRLEKDNAQYHALEENLKQTLIVAQRTAEEVMAASRKNSDELRQNTVKECQNMKKEAEMEAKRVMDESLHQVRTVVGEYDRIDDARRQFLRKYKLALESELSFVNESISDLPDKGAKKPAAAPAPVKSDMPQAQAQPAKPLVHEDKVDDRTKVVDLNGAITTQKG